MDLDQRYELLDKIGAGSYATVYRARDNELGREIAVKQIHQQFLEDPDSLERYWSEAQLLASLHHPNIVTIFDIYRDRGWLILELMQGSLKDRLAGKQMDLRSLRASLAHCLRALKYLHERGIIHGDIKPGNMMIDHRRRVKIGDFGLSRRVSNEEGSLLKGTAKYIAPETVSDEFGDVGPHSDLYSLGFSCYELMCGSENFEDLFPGLSAFGRDKQAAWMMWHAAPDRHLPEIPRVLEGVPKDLALVVGKLVTKDPQQRYASADEALSDLSVDVKVIKTGPEPSGDDEEPVAAADDDTARNKRLPVVIAVFVLSVAMSIGMLFIPSGTEDPAGPANTTVGLVRNVDLDRNEIEFEALLTRLPELLPLGDRPTIRLLRLGESEQFILPRDIEPGDWIEIERSEEGEQLIQLTVSRPAMSEGTIRSVDTAENRVTVAVTEGSIRDDLVMHVPDRAEVLINNEPAELRELSEDDSVEVTHLLDPAGKLGHVASRLSAYHRRELTAFIEEVDLEQNELHLSYGESISRKEVLPFASNAEIVMRTGEAVEMSELRPGDRVTVTADVLIYKLVVTREGQQLNDAEIAGIDLSARQLSVLNAERQQMTFQVPEDADITLELEAADLSELRSEIDTVTVTYSEATDGTLTAGSVDARRGILHNRWGLVVGTQAYADRSLTPLQYTTADAQLVDETLRKRYATDPSWALRLLDENRNEARDEIQQHLARVGTGHQLIVYIVGHAYLGPDDVVYLALKDFSFDDMSATGLPLDWLVEQIEGCKAEEKLLLLDIVHAGRGSDLDQQPSLPQLVYQLKTPIHSIDIIGSASEDQRGNVLPDERHGAFAHFVSERPGRCGGCGSRPGDHGRRTGGVSADTICRCRDSLWSASATVSDGLSLRGRQLIPTQAGRCRARLTAAEDCRPG